MLNVVKDEYGNTFFFSRNSSSKKLLNKIQHDSKKLNESLTSLDLLSYEKIKKFENSEKTNNPYVARCDFFSFAYLLTSPISLIFAAKPNPKKMRALNKEYVSRQRVNLHKALDFSSQLHEIEIASLESLVNSQCEEIIESILLFVAYENKQINDSYNDFEVEKFEKNWSNSDIENAFKDLHNSHVTINSNNIINSYPIKNDGKSDSEILKGISNGFGAEIVKFLFDFFMGR